MKKAEISVDSQSPVAVLSKTSSKRLLLGKTLLFSIRTAFIAAVLLVCFLAFGPALEVVPGGDKGNHFLAFLVLSLLLDLSFPESGPGLVKVAVLAAFGASIEFIQHYLPGRDMSSLDILADILGIIAYVLLWNHVGKLDCALRFRELLCKPRVARA